jgi:hypothetical protein
MDGAVGWAVPQRRPFGPRLAVPGIVVVKGRGPREEEGMNLQEVAIGNSSPSRSGSVQLRILAVMVALAASVGGAAGAQPPLPVEVVNLPEVQQVEGPVRVEQPIPHSRFHRIVDVAVPPGSREQTLDLVAGGRIDTAGFTQAALSLHVVTGDLVPREGTVGAWLVPTDERIAQVLEQDAEVLFALEVSTVVTPGDGLRHFGSAPTRQPLAFPAYRVLFYNGSGKAVTVSLFAYLTH